MRFSEDIYYNQVEQIAVPGQVVWSQVQTSSQWWMAGIQLVAAAAASGALLLQVGGVLAGGGGVALFCFVGGAAFPRVADTRLVIRRESVGAECGLLMRRTIALSTADLRGIQIIKVKGSAFSVFGFCSIVLECEGGISYTLPHVRGIECCQFLHAVARLAKRTRHTNS